MERKILNVFIASPSDLNDERQEIRDVVARINKVFGRKLNIHIDLLGWEDTTPGFNRPQSIINEDVITCDLFIGLLYKRWGTNSGKYSSGFEEEFEITRKRKLNNEEVEVWLFFKKIEKDLVQDPGEQLKKVINFRKEQIIKKELFFKDFEKTEDFSTIIYDNLSSHLLNLHVENNIDLVKVSPSNIEKQNPVMKNQLNIITPQEEISDTYKYITENISNKQENKINFWFSLRAYLSSFSIYANLHSKELLNTHEFQYIYRVRKKWTISENERKFIIRSFLGGSDKNISGWYWLQDSHSFNSISYLKEVALYDYNEELEIEAIKLLNILEYKPEYAFISELLSSDENEKILEAIYLSNNCNGDDVLDNLLIDLKNLFSSSFDKVRKLAINTYIIRSYQKDPNESFKIFCNNSSDVTNFYKELLESLTIAIKEEDIIELGLSSKKHVRLYCSEYLYKNDSITVDLADRLLLDPESQIRKFGFEFLIENERNFSRNEIIELFPKPKKENNSLLSLGFNNDITDEEMIPLLLKKKSHKELLNLVDYYSQDGDKAYRILAEEYDSIYNELFRKNLADDFKEMQKEATEKLFEKYGEASKSLIDSYKEKSLNKFIKTKFFSIAILGISNYSKKSDMKFVRKYIQSSNFLQEIESSLKIIKKFGNSSDITMLLNLAQRSYIYERDLLVSTAYDLSKNKEKFTIDLLNLEDKEFAILGFEKILSIPEEKRTSLLKEYLSNDNEAFRLRALEEITKLWGINKLEEFLDEYIEKGQYFYTDVLYLDKYLYLQKIKKDK